MVRVLSSTRSNQVVPLNTRAVPRSERRFESNTSDMLINTLSHSTSGPRNATRKQPTDASIWPKLLIDFATTKTSVNSAF